MIVGRLLESGAVLWRDSWRSGLEKRRKNVSLFKIQSVCFDCVFFFVMLFKFVEDLFLISDNLIKYFALISVASTNPKH